MSRTLIKKITNVYYSIERGIRNLFSGPKKLNVAEQIETVKQRHTVDDVLEKDVRYCQSLLAIIDPKALPLYTPLVGLRIVLPVVHPNVYSLLVLLNDASRIVHEKVVVTERIQRSRNLAANLRMSLLDDYLTTEHGHQLKPTEVYNALMLQLETLQKALLSESADESGRVDYYIRQFTHLMGETESVILALLEAQLHAKSGSQSDTRLRLERG